MQELGEARDIIMLPIAIGGDPFYLGKVQITDVNQEYEGWHRDC